MKRSTDRILTTHVGSLVRPPPIREVMRARANNEPYDESVLGETLRGSVVSTAEQNQSRGRRKISPLDVILVRGVAGCPGSP